MPRPFCLNSALLGVHHLVALLFLSLFFLWLLPPTGGLTLWLKILGIGVKMELHKLKSMIPLRHTASFEWRCLFHLGLTVGVAVCFQKVLGKYMEWWKKLVGVPLPSLLDLWSFRTYVKDMPALLLAPASVGYVFVGSGAKPTAEARKICQRPINHFTSTLVAW